MWNNREYYKGSGCSDCPYGSEIDPDLSPFECSNTCKYKDDGYCDDGAMYLNLNCATFEFDGGDCD